MARKNTYGNGALAGLARRIVAQARGWITRPEPVWPADHPFLQGAYAPVPEADAWQDAEVVGTIPAEISGVYLRNGPNPAHPPLGRYHWFDGDGLVHAVRIAGGRAQYRSRFVRTQGYLAEAEAGRALWGGLLDPPFVSRPPKGMGRSKNPANTALLHHHDKLLALYEGGVPYEISPTDLGTVGRYLFNGDLDHVFCAHPKVHPDGHLHAFGAVMRARPPYLYYSVFDPRGRRLGCHPIELPGPVMMHDFAITNRYAVFLDLPQRFQLYRLFLGRGPFTFDARRPARFGVFDRLKGQPVRWFEDEACFVFHVVGAWEEHQTVVLQACRYPRFPGGLAVGGGGGEDEARLVEWRLDLSTGRTSRRQLLDPAVEFPRIDARETGQRPSAAYLLAADRRSLLRYQPQTEAAVAHPASDGLFDEPCPIDERWVAALSIRPDCGPSTLQIIDGARFGEAPVAEIRLPRHVPHGLHGLWLAR